MRSFDAPEIAVSETARQKDPKTRYRFLHEVGASPNFPHEDKPDQNPRHGVFEKQCNNHHKVVRKGLKSNLASQDSEDRHRETVDFLQDVLASMAFQIFCQELHAAKDRTVKNEICSKWVAEQPLWISMWLKRYYGPTFQKAFDTQCARVNLGKKALCATWNLIKTYEEGLRETIVGEYLRFLLGPSQPKMQMLCSSVGIEVTSRFIDPAETYKNFLGFNWSNLNLRNHYLENLSPGLVYCMMVRDIDRHSKQILVARQGKKCTAIFIDFGMAGGSKRAGGYDLEFNENDLRFMPFVGRASGHGGIFAPANWLGVRFYDSENGRVESHVEDFDHDPRTHKNPRYQLDMHQAVLRLLLIPPELISVFCDTNKKPLALFLQEFAPTLADLLAKQIAANLNEGREELIVAASKINEFNDYLENVTIYDIREIAQEFFDFVKENKKRYPTLGNLLGDTLEKVFDGCTQRLILTLIRPPFGFRTQKFLFQLKILHNNLNEEYFDAPLSANRRIILDWLFCEKSSEEMPLCIQFCQFDHQMRKGLLSPDAEVALNKLEQELKNHRAKDVVHRIRYMKAVISRQKVLRKLVENFTLPLLRKFLIWGGEEDDLLFKIPENSKSQNAYYLFLVLDEVSWQTLMNVYFSHQNFYNNHSIAINLWNFLLQLREEKIAQLTEGDLKILSEYANIEKAGKLASEIKSLIPSVKKWNPIHESIILNIARLVGKPLCLETYTALLFTHDNVTRFRRQCPKWGLPLGTPNQLKQIEIIDELEEIVAGHPLGETMEKLKRRPLQESVFDFILKAEEKIREFSQNKSGYILSRCEHALQFLKTKREDLKKEKPEKSLILNFKKNSPRFFISEEEEKIKLSHMALEILDVPRMGGNPS